MSTIILYRHLNNLHHHSSSARAVVLEQVATAVPRMRLDEESVGVLDDATITLDSTNLSVVMTTNLLSTPVVLHLLVDTVDKIQFYLNSWSTRRRLSATYDAILPAFRILPNRSQDSEVRRNHRAKHLRRVRPG
jgi:hypothetical protein